MIIHFVFTLYITHAILFTFAEPLLLAKRIEVLPQMKKLPV
jgi:hypothetical protein